MNKCTKNNLFLLIILLITNISCNNSKKEQLQNSNLNSILSDTTAIEKVNLNKPESTSIFMFVKTIDNDYGDKCDNKIILFIKAGNVRAIGRICDDPYSIFNYYEGVISDLKITGNGFFFNNCGGSGEGPEMCMDNNRFRFQLNSDSTMLKIENINYSISKLKYNFKTKKMKIFDTPNFNSKVLQELKSENMKIELLEIGNIEKKGESWDIWYKVKTDTNVGWSYGHFNYYD